jgi:hypothetical protein
MRPQRRKNNQKEWLLNGYPDWLETPMPILPTMEKPTPYEYAKCM